MDVIRYFWYTIILIYTFVYHILWPLRFGWLLVLSIYKEDYLHISHFDYTAFAVSGKVWYGTINRFDHTSWMAVGTPTGPQ